MSAEHETQSGAPPLLPGAQERQRILELGSSVWAFSALAGAVEAGILDELATPRTPVEIGARTGASAALIEAVLDRLVGPDLVPVGGEANFCTPRPSGHTHRPPPRNFQADPPPTPVLAG